MEVRRSPISIMLSRAACRIASSTDIFAERNPPPSLTTRMTFRPARNRHGPPRACRRGNYPIVHFQVTDLHPIAPYAEAVQSKAENTYNSLVSHHRGVPVRPNPGGGAAARVTSAP